MPQPPFALLADIDGPVSNPDAKAIVDKRIIPALTELLDAGIPVVFNTGRSADFVKQSVFAQLLKQAKNNLHLLHAVCEKGAVWLSLNDDGSLQQHVDESIAVPPELLPLTRELIKEKYSSTMFFDETKETMISVERNVNVDGDAYLSTRTPFAADLEALTKANGYTVTYTGPDRDASAQFQVDPSIIAVDLESTKVGKDLGASRAVQMLTAENSMPKAWRTIGDSATDYAMAQWLHDQGEVVAHIDVGPERGPQEHAFAVFRPKSSRDDEAGGAYIAWLSALVRGATTISEVNFDDI